MESTPWPMQVVLVAVIAIYAYDRFNSPPTNRASTTAARYHVAAFVYFSLYVMTFNVIVRYPELLDFFGFDIKGTLADLDVSSAVGVALLLTVLLPRAPLLSHIDARLRKYLQRRAAIPSEATRLSKELFRSEFSVPENQRAELVKDLAAVGFEERHVSFDSDGGVRALWTTVEYLLSKLHDWESEHKFSAFMHSRAAEFAKLKEHHKNIRMKAKTCFELCGRLEDAGEDEKFVEVVGVYESGFREDLQEMRGVICDFISQAVLSCKVTHGGRRQRLSSLGFKHRTEAPRSRLGANHVMALAVILIPVFFINFIFFAPKRQEVAYGLILAVMIVTIYCVAVICAVYGKDRWAFSRRTADGFRPWSYYVVSGLVAVAIGLPVSIVFKMMIALAQAGHQSLLESFVMATDDLVSRTWPYFFLSLVMAAVTAHHLDNKPSPRMNGLSLRIVECLSLSAIMAATGYMVFELLTLVAEGLPEARVPPLERLLVVSAIAGGVVGLLVPQWYRNARASTRSYADEARDAPTPGGLDPLSAPAR